MRRPTFISPACKEKHHDECDGWVPRKEWNEHDQECDCYCHLTMAQRLRIKALGGGYKFSKK
jgi:hypothetical protein